MDGPMDTTSGTLSEGELLPAAIAMTVADLMAAGLMIVTSLLLKGTAKEMKTFLCISGCFGTAVILLAWTNYIPDLYERAEEEGSVVPLQLAIIGFSAITVVYKIAVTFAVTLRWRRVTIANYRDSLLNEDETGEENQILEPALRSRDSTEMSSPVSVELELCTQDNVAYSSLPWRQRQTTQPQEHQEGPLSQNDREIDQESVAIEPQQNIAYSAVTWRQSQATQQKASGEDTSSSRGHEIIGPESLQINIAYSSTFWRQDEDNQLQETEEEYSYVNIN